MVQKKQIKLSLTTAIILIIVFIAVLTLICFSIIKSGQNSKAEKNTGEAIEMHDDKVTDDGKMTSKIKSNEDFATRFLKMENNEKNIIYSPLSIKYALNLLSEGANQNTKKEIENVIGNLSLSNYKNIDRVLSLANAVYVRDTYAEYVKDEYIENVKEKYNSEIKYDSFKNAENINKWIEEKTLGIIKNMLSDEIVKNNASMMLINSLAIDMEWQRNFEAKDTHGEEFNLANGSKINATTMNKTVSDDSASYYIDEDITAVSMNLKKYEDTQLEFIAIMPKDKLSDYINKFSKNDIDNITKKLTSASTTQGGIRISIPRFSFDYNLKLKDDLINLGITEAFKNSADFTGMTNDKAGLHVSDALHKANIEFTEKGIKAAASTVIVMMENAVGNVETPKQIKFDKPFLYIIRDKQNGEIFFIGALYEPNSWENDKSKYDYR